MIPVVRVDRQKATCKLVRGEVKRLPWTGALLGYYVACPACAFRSIVLPETHVLTERADSLHSLAAIRCGSPFCKTWFSIREGHFHIETGP